MSLLFIDGFDHYSDIREKWDVGSVFDNPTFAPGRFGGQALQKQFQNAAGRIFKSLGQQSEVFFGMAMKFPALSSSTHSFFRFKDTAGVTQYSVSVNPDGSLTVNAAGNLDTSASNVIVAGSSWFYIEGRYIAKSSAGAGGVAEVRVNGVTVASIDGALHPTTAGASDDIRTFEFYDSGTNSPAYLYDDMYLLNGDGTSNNTYLGDVRVTTLYPKGNGYTNNFAPSTGPSNYQDVDETLLNGDTDYVESGNVGAKDDYDMQDFADVSVTPGNIYAVQACNGVTRNNVASIGFKNNLVIGGIEYSDEVEHLPTTGQYLIKTYLENTDPSDNGTWTESKVNAVGCGVEITSKEV